MLLSERIEAFAPPGAVVFRMNRAAAHKEMSSGEGPDLQFAPVPALAGRTRQRLPWQKRFLK